MPYRSFLPQALFWVCALAGSAAAQLAPPVPDTSPSTPFGGVRYGAVDAATVRVFAVGDVGTEQVRGRTQMRVVAIPETGHGSGAVVDSRGVVVTAAHVVAGARHIAVRLPGAGGLLAAEVVHQDDLLDFALILVAVDGTLPNVLPIPEAPPTLSVRQTVDAVGYPLDATREHPQSTRGIVSAALEDGRLQLGIAVNPGNSGGPLVDESESLVGIVVARGDVSRGVQGIGVAVPMQPIRAAYDQALRGAFARAVRSLRARPDAARSAEVVDALVRLGGVEVLAEAADIADGVAAPQRLAHFDQVASQTNDPSLLALLAAYFWDASLVILERSGGAATPAHLPPGGPRDVATRAQTRARELAQKAAELDPTLPTRSPFVAYLATGRTAEPAYGGNAMWSSTSPTPAPPRERRQDTSKGWFPMITGGYQADVASTPSNGFQLAFYAPLVLTGTRASSVRFAFGLGVAFSFNRQGDDYWDDEWDSMDVYALVGPSLRFGRSSIGGIVQVAWAPGARNGCPDCYGDDSWEPTLLSFRLSAGPTFGRFHMAVTARIAEGHVEPGYDDGMLVAQIGGAAGLSF
ncbi:MAG: serine protease [Sandaracinus sp.]|nr:serine protease [Sandaracinus sp.]